MKINGFNNVNVNPVMNAKNVAQSSAVEKPQVTSKSPSDKMEVSVHAQLMQKLLQKTGELPDIRNDRVQEITSKIDNGTFRVDANMIASKLLGQ